MNRSGVLFRIRQIALLVLLPETGAAIRAAARNHMQTSLNLALGSGLAAIGLTIPVVAVVSIVFDLPLELGLSSKETVLLAITLLVSALTLGGGTATVFQGAVHLVLFAACELGLCDRGRIGSRHQDERCLRLIAQCRV
jgi:Ca2+:H+ antiporter